MRVLLSVKSSGTQPSNVEGQQMTGDAYHIMVCHWLYAVMNYEVLITN